MARRAFNRAFRAPSFINNNINWTDPNTPKTSAAFGTFNRLGDRSDGWPVSDY